MFPAFAYPNNLACLTRYEPFGAKSAQPRQRTVTPKETKYVSNIACFGEPVYSCSLKQGIRDGFLASCTAVKVHIGSDV